MDTVIVSEDVVNEGSTDQRNGGGPRTYVLVHGAFQVGSTWTAVAAELKKRGHDVHTPTVDGHGPGARLDLHHADAVTSLVTYVRDRGLSDIVLVGHSIAGSFIAKATEEVSESIARLVFHSAFVPLSGGALIDEFPPEQATLFSGIDSARGFILPFDVWRELACNDLDFDTAERLYANMWPIPTAYLTDAVELSEFYQLIETRRVKASYVHAIDDIALPPGEYGWYPRHAQRLGSLCRSLQCRGGHEAKSAWPAELASALIKAGRD